MQQVVALSLSMHILGTYCVYSWMPLLREDIKCGKLAIHPLHGTFPPTLIPSRRGMLMHEGLSPRATASCMWNPAVTMRGSCDKRFVYFRWCELVLVYVDSSGDNEEVLRQVVFVFAVGGFEVVLLVESSFWRECAKGTRCG